jgi:hypothetical protein
MKDLGGYIAMIATNPLNINNFGENPISIILFSLA